MKMSAKLPWSSDTIAHDVAEVNNANAQISSNSEHSRQNADAILLLSRELSQIVGSFKI